MRCYGYAVIKAAKSVACGQLVWCEHATIRFLRKTQSMKSTYTESL